MRDLQEELGAAEPAPRPVRGWLRESVARVWRRQSTVIALFSAGAILVHLFLRFALRTSTETAHLPLLATLVLGGGPLLYQLLRGLLKGKFGSDLLGGVSIVTSVLLGEYLAGSIICWRAVRRWSGTPCAVPRRCSPPWPNGCRRSPTGNEPPKS